MLAYRITCSVLDKVDKMDNTLKAISQELRNMTSNQAADWLIKTYPADDPKYGEALQLIPHISWKRADQIRLAGHYLKKMPFASSKVYDTFASFMSFELFVKVIQQQLPIDKSDISLLLYHLRPVLERAAKTSADHELMRLFMDELM
jgi:hypothetical protein